MGREEEKEPIMPPPEVERPVRGRGRGRGRGSRNQSNSSVIRSNTVPSADISQSAPLFGAGFDDENFMRLIRGAIDDASDNEHSAELIQQQRVLMQDLME